MKELGRFTRLWIAEKAMNELEAAIESMETSRGAIQACDPKYFDQQQRDKVLAGLEPRLMKSAKLARRRVALLVELELTHWTTVDAQEMLDKIDRLESGG